MKRFNLLPLSLGLMLPMFAFAQDLGDTMETINDLLSQVIPILMIIATIAFIWGIIKYIFAGGDEEGVADAKGFMLWSVIALAVMVSVWGIVGVLVDTFGVGGGGIPSGPGQ